MRLVIVATLLIALFALPSQTPEAAARQSNYPLYTCAGAEAYPLIDYCLLVQYQDVSRTHVRVTSVETCVGATLGYGGRLEVEPHIWNETRFVYSKKSEILLPVSIGRATAQCRTEYPNILLRRGSGELLRR